MKTLYIAEKPSLATVVAHHLFGDKVPKGKTCFDGGDTIVTWAYGHILGLANPEAYDEKYKYWNNYPIYPEKWILLCDPTKHDQFKAIGKMLKECDTVVNVGDPDREGQLLIDEILIFLKYKGNVKRLLLPGLDDTNVNRAFKQMIDNKEMHNLYLAGLCREQADWLVGMNLTRAYTVSARAYGHTDTMVTGRVKIPTLALVVRREREILNFKPHDFYELTGIFSKDDVHFKAKLVPDDSYPLDAERRIIDKDFIQSLLSQLSGAVPQVLSAEKKQEKKKPPLPHSLDTLQIQANKKYGYTPSQVLDMVQKMYERKFVTYPRSDCNYIPEAQFEDAPAILKNLKANGFEEAGNADTSIKSACWNDKKVTAHNAIIPTTVKPTGLTADEDKIYHMIAMNYILQFYPPCISDNVTFKINVGGCTFKGSGHKVISPGFTAILHGDKTTDKENEEDNAVLPSLAKGDILDVSDKDYEILTKSTTPPKRFTEGTLLKAMATIWLFIDPKNPNRDKLKEVKGIGTPATRDTIIAELQGFRSKKKSGPVYMEKKGKFLVPTELGCYLIDNIDQSLTYPDTTAEMELALSEIAAGKYSPRQYMEDVKKMIEKNIDFAHHHKFPAPGGSIKCPVCHDGQLVRIYVKSTKQYLFVCSDQSCVHPKTGKRIFYEATKDHSKPLVFTCKKCSKTPLTYRTGKFGDYFVCEYCGQKYQAQNGKPVLKQSIPGTMTDTICPICHKGHLMKFVKNKDDIYYVCENKCHNPDDPKWIMRFQDYKGKPLIETCPICHGVLASLHNPNGLFFKCSHCDMFLGEKNGKPVLKTSSSSHSYHKKGR